MHSIFHLRKLLSQTPLDIKKIRYLSSGDDSLAYLCDDKYVVKVPRRKSDIISQKREFELYRFFETKHLPNQVPRCIWTNDQFNIMDYIPGTEITNQDYQYLDNREKDLLAEDEAVFLKDLHAISGADKLFPELVEDKRETFNKEYEELLCILRRSKLLSAKAEMTISKIYENIFSSDFLFKYAPCLIHNDFSRNNLVFQQNRLAGVIDFGDFKISDPDNDFLCLLDGSNDDFGIEFGMRVLKFYQHPDPQTALRKAQIYNAYWPIQQILYGARRKNKSLFRRGLRSLSDVNPQDFLPER